MKEETILQPNLDRLAREGTILLQQHVVSRLYSSRYGCLLEIIRVELQIGAS